MDERIASLQTVESFLFNNKILPVCWDVILWVTGLLHYSVRGFINLLHIGGMLIRG